MNTQPQLDSWLGNTHFISALRGESNERISIHKALQWGGANCILCYKEEAKGTWALFLDA